MQCRGFEFGRQGRHYNPAKVAFHVGMEIRSQARVPRHQICPCFVPLIERRHLSLDEAQQGDRERASIEPSRFGHPEFPLAFRGQMAANRRRGRNAAQQLDSLGEAG